MAITDYDSLKTEIEAYLHRAGESSARTDTYIDLCEAKLARQLRIRCMETSANLTISSQTVALPTGFQKVRRLYISGSPNFNIDQIGPDAFWSLYLSSQGGQPEAYCIEGENIVVGPTPDSTYTGKLLYYKKLNPLSDSNTTNWFIDNAPDLLLYGSLVEASLYWEKPNDFALRWATAYDSVLEDVKRADKQDRFSPNVQQRPVGVSSA